MLATQGVLQINGTGGSANGLPLIRFLTAGKSQVYLFTTDCVSPELVNGFESLGATVRAKGKDKVDLEAVFRSLHQDGIRSVLVEGGGTLDRGTVPVKPGG